ncbi:MAG TPA: hypothetical protein VFL17_14500 [Anaerolineae bacterium]|nr:hypothetical protein [Anaerolineae bacterium]
MSISGTGSCSLCEGVSLPVSSALALCAHCLRERFAEVKSRVQAVHLAARAEFGLPGQPPRHLSGVRCMLCANECVIGEGERGYCGLRTVREGRLVHLAGTPARGRPRQRAGRESAPAGVGASMRAARDFAGVNHAAYV